MKTTPKFTKMIIPPSGFINHLAEKSGYSRQTVSKALRGHKNTPAAKAIRKLYKKFYETPTERFEKRQTTLNF